MVLVEEDQFIALLDARRQRAAEALWAAEDALNDAIKAEVRKRLEANHATNP